MVYRVFRKTGLAQPLATIYTIATHDLWTVRPSAVLCRFLQRLNRLSMMMNDLRLNPWYCRLNTHRPMPAKKGMKSCIVGGLVVFCLRSLGMWL